jgi:hypothetical protein
MERWKEHFEDLLNPTNTNREKEERKSKTEINKEINRDNEITLKEVQEAIKSIKKGKAARHDGITPEMIKRLGENGTQTLLEIFRKAWAKTIQDWEIGLLTPIYSERQKYGINSLKIKQNFFQKNL